MSVYKSKNWKAKLDSLFGPVYPDVAIAAKAADKVWQRAFDNVLAGIDEELIQLLYIACEFVVMEQPGRENLYSVYLDDGDPNIYKDALHELNSMGKFATKMQ